MKPSLQTFMSPGDTRTVPRRLYKADVNPDSDYRQWTTLKQSAVDRCTSDTQLQLHNVNPDDITCESPQELTQTTLAATEELKQEEGEQESLLVQAIQETQNSSYTQNVDHHSLPESPKSNHSIHT